MNNQVQTPLKWFGGKFYLSDQILPLPAHRQYVEVFGGGMSMLFAKERSYREVYNDVNDRLVNFWRVLQSQPYDLVLECQRIGQLDSRALFLEYKEPSPDSIEDAARFLYVNKLSFSGKNDAFHGKEDKGARAYDTFIHVLDRLQSISDRIQGVLIEQQDFRTIFKRFDDPDTIFYVDPPYVQGGDSYEKMIGGKTWTEQDLIDCLDLCSELQGKVCISLDKKELCPTSFYCYPISRQDRCAHKHERVNIQTEYLFTNYDRAKILHNKHTSQRSLFEVI